MRSENKIFVYKLMKIHNQFLNKLFQSFPKWKKFFVILTFYTYLLRFFTLVYFLFFHLFLLLSLFIRYCTYPLLYFYFFLFSLWTVTLTSELLNRNTSSFLSIYFLSIPFHFIALEGIRSLVHLFIYVTETVT